MDLNGKKALLDELAHTVATVERRVFPTPPHVPEMRDRRHAETRAIAELILGWGYARIGERATAEILRDRSIPPLRARNYDVPDWAADAYAWRIEQALAGGEFPAPLAEAFFERPSDPYDVYQLERLRQSSYVLEPSIYPDAMNRFHQKQGYDRTSPRPPLVPLEEAERASLRQQIEWAQEGPCRVELMRLLRRACVTPREPLASYVPLWRVATDRFTTNYHYSLTAIELVDILVHAACR